MASSKPIEYLGSATDGFAITPVDAGNNQFPTTRGLTSVSGGTATVRFAESSADVQVQLNAGVTYSYCVNAVRLTGTAATGIVGLR